MNVHVWKSWSEGSATSHRRPGGALPTPSWPSARALRKGAQSETAAGGLGNTRSPRLDAEVGRGTPSSAFGALPLSRSSASMASSTLGVWRKSCTVRSHHILRHLAHRTPDVLHRRASLAITQTSSSEYYTDEPHLLNTEARRTWSAMPASYLTAKWVK